MDVTDCGIVRVPVKPVQSAKAADPMLVTVDGIVIDVNLKQS